MIGPGFAVSVYFEIRPGMMAAFRARMIRQAKDSLRLEEKCRQFDIGHTPERPETVFLYELYDDAEAFDAHLASAHFKAFEKDVEPMIVSRKIETWQLIGH